MIKFHNTLSGKLEEFKPLREGEVTLYTCGPTVYDCAHIGNFRTFVFEDLLRRFLEYKGYKIKHVMNVTDVDDKTIAGAQRERKALGDFTATYTQAFNKDLDTLHILRPTAQPLATAEIPAMVKLIESLIAKGAAYVNDGSVYYRVASFPKYGNLSKKNLEKNIKGARVDVDEYDKEDGSDFVLWKKAREGEPSWDSPWGKGRPGWHIECSVMSMKYLGETIDIHAGGEDLIFPHHENEIAQSEAATGKPFVKYWLHAKHLLVDGEKMSKSKGNFYTLRDLLAKKYKPAEIRYVLLSVHYLQQLNFTLDGLQAAQNALKDLAQFYSSVINYEVWRRLYSKENKLESKIRKLRENIIEALENDLEVSQALAAIFKFIGETDSQIKKSISKKDHGELLLVLNLINQIFDVVPDEHYDHFGEEAQKLKMSREVLRKEKRFQEADECRQKLYSLGFLVWDEATGVSGIARM